MASSAYIKFLKPLARSMILRGPSASLQRSARTAAFSSVAATHKITSPLTSPFRSNQIRHLGSDPRQTFSRDNEETQSLTQILENEIQEETIELNKNLSSDQFPGFSVETDDSDVKLTKQVGDATVVIRFTVSSSLSEWKNEAVSEQPDSQQQQEAGFNFSLLSMPEFQVQIIRNGKTLEASCYFEEMEHDEESGETYPADPLFHIDEIVMYDGEPRETEFAVSTEYFREELQEGLLQYLAEHGVDDEFAKNLVSFSTNYEKKMYIGLMKRLKDFVSK